MSRRIFAKSVDVTGAHLWMEKTFSSGVWIIAIMYYTGVLPDVIDFLDTNTLAIGRSKLSILEILQGLISVVITVLLALWASAALDSCQRLRAYRLDMSKLPVMFQFGDFQNY